MDKIDVNIDGITLNPLKIITGDKGSVLHALKSYEKSYISFGEAYFSTIHFNEIKGWKKHHEMILNIVVPVGKIKFVVFDDRIESPTKNNFFEIVLSPENYYRLTVQPGLWMAFKGMNEGLNMLLNIASIPHNPNEAENLSIEKINYKNW
ncbi:MAG: dTDP-4-dehydrorhamnose 3,5-epimerase [Bacteroidia bacterium]